MARMRIYIVAMLISVDPIPKDTPVPRWMDKIFEFCDRSRMEPLDLSFFILPEDCLSV
jgi:hypothetical protein